MARIILFTVACLVFSVQGYPQKKTCTKGLFPFVKRENWGAEPPRDVTKLQTPVEYVVIHHTYIPGVCITRNQCQADMRSMQHTHMNTNMWADIGYNFAVGGEGSAYEGRGWEAVGAHAAGLNSQSIGIVLIGDFMSQLPVARQLKTAKSLIALGVRLGYIRPDYKLIGHRQASATECPGEALYKEISTWNHFTESVQKS